jgi:hypothetical protein
VKLHRHLAWTLSLTLAASACGDGPTPIDVPGWSCEAYGVAFAPQVRRFDILLVVDTAPAMADHHTPLIDNLGRFASVLANLEGGLPSLHIGVIAGDGDGRMIAAATTEGCPTPDGTFLRDTSRPWFQCSDDPRQSCRDRNYDAPLGDTLSCTGGLDATGERAPLLASALRALDGSHPENQGFVRDGSFLTVVFLTADDDASPASVDEYADALAGFEETNRILVSAVLPAAAPRLEAFLDRFPNRSASISIADPDWSDAFVPLADLWIPTIGSCLEGADPTDLEPDRTGLQLACWVTDRDDPSTLVPACTLRTDARPDPDTPLPCWWVESEPDCGLLPHFERAEDGPGGSAVELRCAGLCGDPP